MSELVSKLLNVALPDAGLGPRREGDGAVPVAGVVELPDLLVHLRRTGPRAGCRGRPRPSWRRARTRAPRTAVSDSFQASSKAAPEPRATRVRLSLDLASNPAIRASAVENVAAYTPSRTVVDRAGDAGEPDGADDERHQHDHRRGRHRHVDVAAGAPGEPDQSERQHQQAQQPDSTSHRTAASTLPNSSETRWLLATTRFVSSGSASARRSALAFFRYCAPTGRAWRLLPRACSISVV